MRLDMTPASVIVGSTVVFMAVVSIVVFYPVLEYQLVEPSEEWRERTEEENRGRAVYMQNGCFNCHSQYVRPQDWEFGEGRVAESGDYVGDTPPLWGSERQGPDLQQAGGLRSDGWHLAHFHNARHVRPDSIMPPFHWLTMAQTLDLTEYVQGLGYLDADARYDRYLRWRDAAYEAYLAGGDANTEWLHAHVPQGIMNSPNQYPATEASLANGAIVYQHYCIGCHGPVGDGNGPAGRFLRGQYDSDLGREMATLIESGEFREAPPYNFTYLRSWEDRGPIGWMIYYQVMNGITGTSMPVFKHELESERIWDVANYIAVNFVGAYPAGGSEEDRWPRGSAIPATNEPPMENEFEPIPLEEVLADPHEMEGGS
jgi:cytochrome c oxidase cbb3-type subunit II